MNVILKSQDIPNEADYMAFMYVLFWGPAKQLMHVLKMLLEVSHSSK
jgi:hypothetical protein